MITTHTKDTTANKNDEISLTKGKKHLDISCL